MLLQEQLHKYLDVLVDFPVKCQVKFNVEKIKIDSQQEKNQNIVSKRLQCSVEMSSSDCQKTQKCCWTGIPGHPCCSLPELCLGSGGFGGCLVCSIAATSAAALLPAGKAAEGSLDFVQQFVSTEHLGGSGTLVWP